MGGVRHPQSHYADRQMGSGIRGGVNCPVQSADKANTEYESFHQSNSRYVSVVLPI